MPKTKPNESAEGVAVGLAAPCNTVNAIGLHLEDIPPIRNAIYASARMFASGDQEASRSLFPTYYGCSHCGSNHAISNDEVKSIVFGSTKGGIDFSAAHDELMAILEGKEAAAAGSWWNNNVSVNSDIDLAEVLNPTQSEATDGNGSAATPSGNAGAGQ